ncbi:MAG: carboxymuconolactone decarboxylase family protein [Planctomycetes bacterium]|nr:carboxymuconolactone decarboxylase family protein [Planctomycetota bacterium]MCC7065321.1 carboxymuconolactone decarboxylase family protein [Planctomycetota bacterium]
MTRIQAIDPAVATGKARTLLDAVKTKMGIVPNLTRVLANAPAALEGYLNFSGALAGGGLDSKVREQIALTVAQANLCDYCLSAHTLIGGKVGLSKDDIQAARAAVSTTPRTDAILKLARAIVVNRGELTDPDLRAARHAGLGDSEIVETIANVALNIFTNYLNHAAQTVIDFPKVESGLTHAHSCDTGACSTKS